MRSRGFTLIEVMVAVVILAMVSTVVWSSFRDTTTTKKNVEAQAVRYRTVRLALDRMAREIAAVERLDERGAVQRITDVLSKSAKGRRLAAESEGGDAETKAA